VNLEVVKINFKMYSMKA